MQRKPLDRLLTTLVVDGEIDLAILVEPADGPTDLTAVGLVPAAGSGRFRIQARVGLSVEPLTAIVTSNDRCGFWHVRTAGGMDGLLVVVHGFDRRNYDDATRGMQFRQVALVTANYERRLGHRRTVLVGDWNAHPFDPAVYGADGLHALGVRSIRGRSHRPVNGEPVEFFYNPMWGQYGSTTAAGSATHYFVRNRAEELVWHMFDQVIVRPESAGLVPENRIRIASEVGDVPLVAGAGRPDLRVGSDHLPVLFDWNIE